MGGVPGLRTVAGGASRMPALSQIDIERERLHVDRANLSSKERALLKDPGWIDEDEADAILAERIFQKKRQRGIPFREYLKKPWPNRGKWKSCEILRSAAERGLQFQYPQFSCNTGRRFRTSRQKRNWA